MGTLRFGEFFFSLNRSVSENTTRSVRFLFGSERETDMLLSGENRGKIRGNCEKRRKCREKVTGFFSLKPPNQDCFHISTYRFLVKLHKILKQKSTSKAVFFDSFFGGSSLLFCCFCCMMRMYRLSLGIDGKKQTGLLWPLPHRKVFTGLGGIAFGSVKIAPQSRKNRAAKRKAAVSARNCNRRKHFHEV